MLFRSISGWGGIDPRTGSIIETRHELKGVSFAGKVLVFPGAKGSSGWSSQFHVARLMGKASGDLTLTIAPGAFQNRHVLNLEGRRLPLNRKHPAIGTN